MQKKPLTSWLMQLAIVACAGNVAVGERADQKQEVDLTPAPLEEGSRRNLDDTRPGSADRSGETNGAQEETMEAQSDEDGWEGSEIFSEGLPHSWLDGPIEIVDVLEQSDDKVNHGNGSTLLAESSTTIKVSRLQAADTVFLVGNLVIEPGDELEVGDTIELGRIANAGDTVFLLRTPRDGVVGINPGDTVTVVTTRIVVCCDYCDACEQETDAEVVTCRKCNFCREMYEAVEMGVLPCDQ